MQVLQLDGERTREIPIRNRALAPGWEIMSAVFAPDGEEILTACYRARIWDRDGNLRSKSEPTGLLFSAMFSPGTDPYILTASYAAHLWNRELEGPLHVYPHPGGKVHSAVFDPEGHSILTACSDGKARIWDLLGDTPRTEFGDEASVWCARFSPDGNLVVTGCDDGTARIWDRAGECRAEIRGHKASIVSVEFSPDGKRILTGSDDGTARVWPVHLEDLLRLAEERAYRELSVEERERYHDLLSD